MLVFSQMTRMLDIIQDYLGYRGAYMYTYAWVHAHVVSIVVMRNP